MKKTGVVRKIDNLGRIVIPKEIRKTQNIKNGDEIEFFLDNDSIKLKKYSTLKQFDDIFFSLEIILKKIYNIKVFLTSTSDVIDSKLISSSRKLNKEYCQLLSGRNMLYINKDIKLSEKIILKTPLIKPVIINGDLMGSVVFSDFKQTSIREYENLISFVVKYIETNIEN